MREILGHGTWVTCPFFCADKDYVFELSLFDDCFTRDGKNLFKNPVDLK